MAKLTKAQLAEKQEAIERLREMLPKGTKVYTQLMHVSSSGMRREIKVRVVQDNEPLNITWLVMKALGKKIGKHEGIVLDGCGTDMGFELVYNLSVTLFCPNGYTHEGAYALKQEWL